MNYESRVKSLQKENSKLRQQISLEKRKRVEACENAENLAEQNFYLENDLHKLISERRTKHLTT